MTRAKILQQVQSVGNVANTLVFRFFWPEDVSDREDAFTGLTSVCWKAKKNLFIPNPDSIHLDESTESFIENALEAELGKFKNLSRAEIAERALRNEFRHIPRVVTLRMIDYIRKVYRDKEPSTPNQQPRSTKQYLESWLNIFRSKRHQLVKIIGERGYETLCILIECASGETRRIRKGMSTETIAHRFRISLQQARAYKRQLFSALESSHDGLVMSFSSSSVRTLIA